MNVLVIDTTADRIAIAATGDCTVLKLGEAGAKKHNSTLLTLVEEALAEAGRQVLQLECIGVVTGPGSFTGIRIGVATANAIAKALQIPVVPLTANEIAAPDFDSVTAIDCKHGNYYVMLRRAGKDEYFAATEAELDKFGLPVFKKGQTDPKRLLEVFNKKLQSGRTTKAQPYYIKESSAERGE